MRVKKGEYRVFECDEEQESNKIQSLVISHLLGKPALA